MTVNTVNITSGPYAGNDIADTFDYTFRVELKTQLSVYETDDLGVQTLLTVDTDYTVAGIGVDAGGTITRVAGALPTGYTWYIRANYSLTQLAELRSQGGFFPDVHEAALDKITFLLQQQDDQLDRSFGLSPSIDIDGTFTVVDDATARASKVLGFDLSGNLIVTSDLAPTVSVTPFMETLLDDTTAAAGRATLDAASLGSANHFTARQRWSKGADIASAATLAVGTDGNYFDVTGTTTITAIDSAGFGTVIKLHFDDALTLTHHAVNLVLPGDADITTSAGDEAEFIEYASGDWRCVNYQAYTPAVKTKILDIGDWNMDITSSVFIAHGLTLGKIRSLSALIRNDVDSAHYDFPSLTPASTGAGEFLLVDVTNVTLTRSVAGLFDTTGFDSTSYNRGWITIQYVD